MPQNKTLRVFTKGDREGIVALLSLSLEMVSPGLDGLKCFRISPIPTDGSGMKEYCR